MLEPTPSMQIFVGLKPVDMRKSVNGLLQEVLNIPGQDPQSGHLYIFRNQKSDLIKAIFWHLDGFVLIQKRLEGLKCSFPRTAGNPNLTISPGQLKWLLSGFDFTRLERPRGPSFTEYS